MYTLTKAKRVEQNNFISSQLIRYLTQGTQLPKNATHLSRDKDGTWFRVSLPAGVTALAFDGANGQQVGYYHSVASVADEIKGLVDALRRNDFSR
jgi:hypothetical protein